MMAPQPWPRHPLRDTNLFNQREPIRMELKPLNPGITEPYGQAADPQASSPSKSVTGALSESRAMSLHDKFSGSAAANELSSERTCMEPWAKKERLQSLQGINHGEYSLDPAAPHLVERDDGQHLPLHPHDPHAGDRARLAPAAVPATNHDMSSSRKGVLRWLRCLGGGNDSGHKETEARLQQEETLALRLKVQDLEQRLQQAEDKFTAAQNEEKSLERMSSLRKEILEQVELKLRSEMLQREQLEKLEDEHRALTEQVVKLQDQLQLTEEIQSDLTQEKSKVQALQSQLASAKQEIRELKKSQKDRKDMEEEAQGSKYESLPSLSKGRWLPGDRRRLASRTRGDDLFLVSSPRYTIVNKRSRSCSSTPRVMQIEVCEHCGYRGCNNRVEQRGEHHAVHCPLHPVEPPDAATTDNAQPQEQNKQPSEQDSEQDAATVEEAIPDFQIDDEEISFNDVLVCEIPELQAIYRHFRQR
uniref:Uncharacterized protein n=1 Tax=Guillardia theta TaxID=55529 RepID=A0A7S4K6C4_GUITH|mmetsp:Transcript_21489/g.71199  ORF Transcript_21489/g.71199 Transcript_21489/m.71199 type:complete len:474 (+) Transcript_21489:225-1646(+)